MSKKRPQNYLNKTQVKLVTRLFWLKKKEEFFTWKCTRIDRRTRSIRRKEAGQTNQK